MRLKQRLAIHYKNITQLQLKCNKLDKTESCSKTIALTMQKCSLLGHAALGVDHSTAVLHFG
jgi:hypothetical protein